MIDVASSSRGLFDGAVHHREAVRGQADKDPASIAWVWFPSHEAGHFEAVDALGHAPEPPSSTL